MKIPVKILKDVCSYYVTLFMADGKKKIAHICRDVGWGHWWQRGRYTVTACGYGLSKGWHIFHNQSDYTIFEEMQKDFQLCEECGDLNEHLKAYEEFRQFEENVQ